MGTGVRLAWGLKALLVTLLLFAVAHRDWERFADKAMVARAVAYPLAALVVPVAWALLRRRRTTAAEAPGAYPADVDALLVAPFVVDVAGNALDLYDRVVWFDDACHLANWALLSSALGCWLLRRRLAPAVSAGLVIGFGATTAILWELAEYQSFLLDTPEVVAIYRDTLGDLALGLTGSVLAGIATAWRSARRRSALPAH